MQASGPVENKINLKPEKSCHLKLSLQTEKAAGTHRCISDCCEHIDGCQTAQRIN